MTDITEGLLCAGCVSKGFICIRSFNLQNNPMRQNFVISLFTYEETVKLAQGHMADEVMFSCLPGQ